MKTIYNEVELKDNNIILRFEHHYNMNEFKKMVEKSAPMYGNDFLNDAAYETKQKLIKKLANEYLDKHESTILDGISLKDIVVKTQHEICKKIIG